jgi:hypothetical protein
MQLNQEAIQLYHRYKIESMIQLHRQAAKSAYPFRTTLTRSSNVQLNQLIQLRLRNLPTTAKVQPTNSGHDCMIL